METRMRSTSMTMIVIVIVMLINITLGWGPICITHTGAIHVRHIQHRLQPQASVVLIETDTNADADTDTDTAASASGGVDVMVALDDLTQRTHRAPGFRAICHRDAPLCATPLFPPGGLNWIRQQINGASVIGTVGGAGPGTFGATIGGFRYLVQSVAGGLPSLGAVLSAAGSVALVSPGGTSPGPVAKKMVGAMFLLNPGSRGQVPEGGGGAIPARNYVAGHIIGAQLGGDNEEPLNFFPHHHNANSNGRYWRAEMVVRAIRDIMNDDLATAGPAAAPCLDAAALQIRIEFTYEAFVAGPPPTGYTTMPREGYYDIYLSQACAHYLASAAAHPIVSGWTGRYIRPVRKWVTYTASGAVVPPVGARGVLAVPKALPLGMTASTTNALGVLAPYYRMRTAWTNIPPVGAGPKPDQPTTTSAPLLFG